MTPPLGKTAKFTFSDNYGTYSGTVPGGSTVNVTFQKDGTTTNPQTEDLSKRPQGIHYLKKSQDRMTLFGQIEAFGTQVEEFLFSFAKDKNQLGQMETGGRGVSTSEKILHMFKGVGMIFTGMLKRPVETLVGMAGVGVLIAVLGPAVLPLLITLGFVIGAAGAIKAYNEAETAKTDEGVRKAYQKVGANVFTMISSLFGAKAAMKAAGTSGVKADINLDETKNPFKALWECMKACKPEKMFGGIKHHWAMKFGAGISPLKDAQQREIDAKRQDIENLENAAQLADDFKDTARRDLNAKAAPADVEAARVNDLGKRAQEAADLAANREARLTDLKGRRDQLSTDLIEANKQLTYAKQDNLKPFNTGGSERVGRAQDLVDDLSIQLRDAQAKYDALNLRSQQALDREAQLAKAAFEQAELRYSTSNAYKDYKSAQEAYSTAQTACDDIAADITRAKEELAGLETALKDIVDGKVYGFWNSIPDSAATYTRLKGLAF